MNAVQMNGEAAGPPAAGPAAVVRLGAAPDSVRRVVDAWNEAAACARARQRVRAYAERTPSGRTVVSVGVVAATESRVVRAVAARPVAPSTNVTTEHGQDGSVHEMGAAGTMREKEYALEVPRGKMVPVGGGRYKTQSGQLYSVSLGRTDDDTVRDAIRHILAFLGETVPFAF